MAYDYQLLHAIIRRGALVLVLVLSLANLTRAERLATPVATAIRATVSGDSTRITIAGTAPMAYAVARPSEHLLVVELPGVDASKLASSYEVATPLVSGLTVRRSTLADMRTSARLEIALRAPAHDRSRMEDNDLVLELKPGRAVSNGDKAAALAPAKVASETTPVDSSETASQNPTVVTSAPLNSGSQTQQGAQYGQQGFIGEPINLNVVNADIRDILNYITEQYGVNFVIDASVKAVPVTVNVTEVPWNIALDAILKANRLGIEARGNILRVATTEVLAGEAATEAQISDARLTASPLVTEFVRLNYSRASGTLQDAAGASGGFSGGVSSGSASSSAGESSGGGSGTDQGVLPIIRRRLSRRGSVEVDGRSNTLIITDVRENIAAIKQLITLLDQPEPQVEIETRIVIANRNFSRDLGVQLSAVALNASRGAIGSFETLPNTNVGTQPLGIPGGLAGSPSAAPSLGATAASTVIGLTTGIFGTAQISALITAAEVKGQAKIVATPRVTALNNRPAQIESGTQIPVVTPQTGAGGGATVFTTTFISVPLRLSVTPQITDAGTVVLRVVTENNSVNLGLTNSLGTPGIDTQRMQTEVLVPDGGTTVVGGVLADNEGETQNRTPGLAGIPLLGNLFKRRAVTRQTNEILFFITPRIYRPDFAGRPTDGVVSDRTRSVSIPQPVPLGNPPTNTTAPGTQSTRPSNQVDTPFVTGRPVVVQPDADPGVRP